MVGLIQSHTRRTIPISSDASLCPARLVIFETCLFLVLRAIQMPSDDGGGSDLKACMINTWRCIICLHAESYIWIADDQCLEYSSHVNCMIHITLSLIQLLHGLHGPFMTWECPSKSGQLLSQKNDASAMSPSKTPGDVSTFWGQCQHILCTLLDISFGFTLAHVVHDFVFVGTVKYWAQKD